MFLEPSLMESSLFQINEIDFWNLAHYYINTRLQLSSLSNNMIIEIWTFCCWQWFTLTRKHAEMVAEDSKVFSTFVDHCKVSYAFLLAFCTDMNVS